MALYIGLMSGTSLDGVDGILVSIPDDYSGGKLEILADANVPFERSFRKQLMQLQSADINEIELEGEVANTLAHKYAENIKILLDKAALSPKDVTAAGIHGQTIRHRPELGFTRQTNNPALVAELTGIDIIADFRSRDIAAGGQGAPLVPAFHQAVFGSPKTTRVAVNIGGIANISILYPDGMVTGFDTGPGNMLMDAFIQERLFEPYDRDGRWAAKGKVIDSLLESMLDDPYFEKAPPKSTGRDLFHLGWAKRHIFLTETDEKTHGADIQATLLMLTARTIADAILEHAPNTEQVYLCGGGALNKHLVNTLRHLLQAKIPSLTLESSTALGIDPMQVESLAFAWLAHRFTVRKPGNLPAVTGAKGFRILGALYPA
jgi:anhydro-N-acetylmuramic acid kinase